MSANRRNAVLLLLPLLVLLPFAAQADVDCQDQLNGVRIYTIHTPPTPLHSCSPSLPSSCPYTCSYGTTTPTRCTASMIATTTASTNAKIPSKQPFTSVALKIVPFRTPSLVVSSILPLNGKCMSSNVPSSQCLTPASLPAPP